MRRFTLLVLLTVTVALAGCTCGEPALLSPEPQPVKMMMVQPVYSAPKPNVYSAAHYGATSPCGGAVDVPAPPPPPPAEDPLFGIPR